MLHWSKIFQTLKIDNIENIENIDNLIEYGHEAKPSILWVQVVLLAAPRDDDDGARQKL